MKYYSMVRIMGALLFGFLKKDIPDPATRKAIKQEFRQIIQRASDIGGSNTLLSSYTLAAFFIAMNRCDQLTPEDNLAILDRGMRNSKLLKASLGNAESYLSPKRFAQRQKWSELTHQKKYKNDWVVDILPGTDDYDMGYDYLECGVCKLCADEGCPELAHYLCQLDFMLIELVGLRLTRTTTLADGGDKCDFRFHRV